MFLKYKPIYFLTIILFFALFLRFFKLGSMPVSLTIDEINNGYNAFSLLKTGRDEWGIKLPPYFKSTGDYDSPTLIYLTVPTVWLFGLTEFATRLPVAIFSLFTIPVLYVLCRRYLFKNHPRYVSFVAIFLLATSQWHLVYSRSDFEAVIALFFIVLNVLFLFRGIEKKSALYFYFAFFIAVLSAITYHADKIFAPLINLFFVFLNWSSLRPILIHEIRSRKSRLIFFFLRALLVTFFFIKLYLVGPGAARSQMVFFTEDFDFKRALMERLKDFGLSVLGMPMLVLFWWKRFLEYSSLNFYLVDGLGLTIPGHPGAGVINLAIYPFYLLGILSIYLSSHKSNPRKDNLFILGWLVIGFLPATIANNSQHPLRSLNAVIPMILLSSIGLEVFFGYLKRHLRSLIFPILFILIFIFSVDFIRFIDYYIIHNPYELSEQRQYGWKEMAIFASKVHSEYDNIYIDPRFGTEGRTNYGVPYLYFLFYSQYDPQTYHSFPGRDKFISDFENYHFMEIDFNQIGEIKGKNLYIASPWSFPDVMVKDKNIVYKVKFLNGHIGFYAITNKAHDESNLKEKVSDY